MPLQNRKILGKSIMKICVLGNSHVASLKKGWDSIQADNQKYQLTFFASRQKGLAGLKLDNGVLVPSTPSLLNDISYTSGGMEEIPLDEYDVFLLYGLGLSMPILDTRLSTAVIQQTCNDIFNQALSFKIAKLIRSASNSTIYIGHNPLRSMGKIVSPRVNKFDYKEVLGFMSSAVDIADAILIDQPFVTLINDWNTKEEYSIGSTRLDVGDKISNQSHPDNDMEHMNGDFGKLYLDSFFQRLS
jgi:hypothetical protein